MSGVKLEQAKTSAASRQKDKKDRNDAKDTPGHDSRMVCCCSWV